MYNPNHRVFKLPSADEIFALWTANPRGLPGCWGSIDGKHFQITAGADDNQSFRCRKGFRSLNVVATVDLHRRFRFVAPIYPGNTNDSFIHTSSGFGRAMASRAWPPQGCTRPLVSGLHLQPFIVADAGFAGSDLLVKPFPGRGLTPNERNFNRRLSAIRVGSEQAWADVTHRFRFWKCACEWKGEEWQRHVSHAILACMAIHNICLDYGDPVPNDDGCDEAAEPGFFGEDDEETVTLPVLIENIHRLGACSCAPRSCSLGCGI